MNRTSPKKLKIIEGHLAGKKQHEIAKEVYPNSTKHSGEVQVSRVLNSVEVQAALQTELQRQGITLDKALAPVADALTAYKQDQYTGEITPDHNIRLRAAKDARELLGVTKAINHQEDSKQATVTTEDLKKLATTSDEVELTRMIFKKDQPEVIED